MKIKYIIILSGLAVAFAAVSLWVFLSGGNNAKAIRTKFKLGGLMLTVSGMLSLTGCEGGPGPGVMCYDPVAPQYVLLSSATSRTVKVGDIVGITIKDSPYQSHSYKFLVDGKEVLQSGELGKEDGNYEITVEPTEYKGDIYLVVYGVFDGQEYELAEFPLRIE